MCLVRNDVPLLAANRGDAGAVRNGAEPDSIGGWSSARHCGGAGTSEEWPSADTVRNDPLAGPLWGNDPAADTVRGMASA